MIDRLTLVYTICEILLSIHISITNLLVLLAYCRSTHLRTITNTYIFSLALTDFFAGTIGIPLTVYSVLTKSPSDFHLCLGVHLILCILCTISTFHLLAMAIDKYLTICCNRTQQRIELNTNRHYRALALLTCAWLIGFIAGALPLFDLFDFASRRRIDFAGECHFTTIMDYRYLVFDIFFCTIILPTAIICYCYLSIYRRIWREENQIRTLLRASERSRRHRQRSSIIRSLLLLVVAFFICWYPLYTVNSVEYFFPSMHISPGVTLSTVVLSHVSCALNPIIYAFGLPSFKQALSQWCKCCCGVASSSTTQQHYTTINYRGIQQSLRMATTTTAVSSAMLDVIVDRNKTSIK